MKRLLAPLLLSLAACTPPGVLAPPDIPIVPVTYERNLLTMRRCEFRGTVEGVWSAASIDGNLILAFVYDSATYVSSNNGVTQRWEYHGVKGKALRCPNEVVDQLVKEELSRRAAAEDES